MTDRKHPLIFDGHNDVLLQLYRAGGHAAAEQFLTGRDGHIDAPKARKGGFGGGFFAVFAPSPKDAVADQDMEKSRYDLPLPPPLDEAETLRVIMAQAAILLRLEELGALRICRSAAEIQSALTLGEIAAVFHIEGADGIDRDLNTLEVLYRAGLRSLGPVWSRPTIFAHGVPFRFPSDPDIGAGLTEHGVRLVQRCNALGIMVDLSHLNLAGFWDVARVSDKPLVATHSNAHAICPHARNLTDDQLAAIRESDGMVGLNFAAAFLRADGRMLGDVSLDQMIRHLDHLIAHLGEDRVGLGSDFDGAVVPDAMGSAAGLPKLRAAMDANGYGAALMEKLCHGNWMRVLKATWGA